MSIQEQIKNFLPQLRAAREAYHESLCQLELVKIGLKIYRKTSPRKLSVLRRDMIKLQAEIKAKEARYRAAQARKREIIRGALIA